ncbi:MAG: cob(I)yrinic acid a,c-diamide adenosyltransferase [Candidatus Sungbacteria bacterium RIFCSPHIGHO2_02_FULL_49_12]|uniref:Cob(I)yrinic acid a,c-diamide adenosyltransferase n=1 Tax=Candidatus Sungbacteria bacterium RIFCSPHIGHO2_02_FULL_49_12 TaxID=1802271 RepID=A0A1G2KLA4_9BACT|nr:MAG: cob(I)yrinic acid a,c-diamide adenosyltransferase [Candidatus Sungbacteria bacterium RIFCSPHIGHO2_02_FULL_49_12]
MIIVNTGNGKGKTTAALGAALRAVGKSKKVLMIQFIKGPWKSGEDESAKLLFPHFELRKMGLGFVGILGDSLPRSEHEKAAEAALDMARNEIQKGVWDMVILDEVNNALHLNLISKENLLALIDLTPTTCHLILTGRDAHSDILARADLITEMREVKHLYQEGVKAKRGVEY